MKKYKKIGWTIILFGLVAATTAKERQNLNSKNNTRVEINSNRFDKSKKSAKMKKIVVEKIDINKKTDIKEAAILLEKQAKKHLIDVLNWKEFDYKPKVEFRIGYTDNEIWLKYYVSEKYIKALETKTNGDVYKDCCIEFFISFDRVNYYNFEFNCIGTKHAGYGSGRNNRRLIDPKVLAAIRVDPSLGNQPFDEKEGQFDWQLMVTIPFSCFAYSDIKTLDGVNATANFYKCGDGTSVPHYLSWNPINTEQPDFHRPEFFGILNFR